MKWSMLVSEVEHGLEESQNQRDARVERLWAKLGPDAAGALDMKGLKKGFKKLDHPMKYADGMLEKIMVEVDVNKDGKIQYEEFRNFVEKTELELYVLFRNIDKDGNGQLDKKELQLAFKAAGLTVSSKRLDDFFRDMDHNHDGFITYDEWRNFLLFMPPSQDKSKLRAVLTFYDGVVSVTPEGESLVGDESLAGLASHHSTPPTSKNQPDSASIPRLEPPERGGSGGGVKGSEGAQGEGQQIDTPPEYTRDNTDAVNAASPASTTNTVETPRRGEAVPDALGRGEQAEHDVDDGTRIGAEEDSTTGSSASAKQTKKRKLTSFIPDPGYFLAGAIAGGISRTATAPLDRLKVYLLVNTRADTETALAALKQGRPVVALKNAARPFSDAVRDLYKSGGLRGFFAGNGLNVIKIMPETAIKFGSYEAAKRALANLEGHGDPQNINSYSKFTAGGVAGMIAQFFVYPLDTLKFRLQCETVEGGATGAALVRQTAIRMYADGGMRSCYRGVTMGLVGMFPYSAIDMGTFELLKTTYKSYYAKLRGVHEDDVDLTNVATGIIGATSGAFGASVVYPLNVVRTRLQTQGTAMHPPTYTGIWDVTQKTIKNEGFRGLYKGLTPNLLKVAPALSITWLVYENSKKLLGLH